MRLRPVIKKCEEARNSEKSHKEGPTPVGGCLMRLRPVIKKCEEALWVASGNKKVSDCGNVWIIEILVAGTEKKSYTCGSDFTDSQRGQEGLQ